MFNRWVAYGERICSYGNDEQQDQANLQRTRR
ncbi:uncharacterized protein METZ01_LOCUS120609 [marine metagenome]|uniref:Uncharacterized protein n=1 Tax=marine metagenome TaxID=408172 RepID=A0A381XSS1_9ZZZZ